MTVKFRSEIEHKMKEDDIRIEERGSRKIAYFTINIIDCI